MDTKTIIKLALKEDAPKGDITTNALIPKNKIILARFVAKAPGIICGLDVAKAVFQQLDKKIIFTKFNKDGQKVKSGQVIAKVTGKARAILTGERTALNFLQHLSGIATTTKMFVVQADNNSKIYDTRKTTPLLRDLEKYAVRCGGGYNHRLNLSDMVLIKDNHLKAIKNVKLKIKNLLKNKMIEIEAASFTQVKEFLKLNSDIIMLDNMDFELMKKCIKYIRKHSKCEIEVSGNVNLMTVKKIASLKPDRISVGKITHSAPALDISLEF
ncbi:MAG: nicotinate-nucleotide diphosphorylase (carboxylating) [Elusimicrobia bacterium HGW-Elusimicrobia-4]|nr:MAG: nicotinate-nucleotide diphosphorylase (carboxylating) [Elusimicrobia bacterium HGW-Elusimicrobia-4]